MKDRILNSHPPPHQKEVGRCWKVRNLLEGCFLIHGQVDKYWVDDCTWQDLFVFACFLEWKHGEYLLNTKNCPKFRLKWPAKDGQLQKYTHPIANIALEQWWLEDYFLFEMVRFSGDTLVFSGVHDKSWSSFGRALNCASFHHDLRCAIYLARKLSKNCLIISSKLRPLGP